ncbi:sensor histidine kinase NtrY-like [Brytella acorum]|uniref:histidine kinase n=1 Tax=Brytella acorum TaxID=2959299 RepID=A0AA35UHH7_9PROT|nr:PAS domain-containing sensor histidine kinase [Brytella acorum]MDF3624885.1 PAS domain-containing sensor histidine kinase [Brytella acorum]CAI9120190.1 PAS domain-containing sensor histidine kinase [Brytella acorum]
MKRLLFRLRGGIAEKSGGTLTARFLARVASMNTALMLVIVALCLGFVTFVVLAGGMSLAHRPQVEATIFLFDFIVLMCLAAVVTGRVGRMLGERRSGLAGASLHLRLITLFGVVAIAPTVVVGVLAALFFHFGIQIWFSNRVNTALTEARAVAAGYLQEHNENIRSDAYAIANNLITEENDDVFRGSGSDDLFHDPERLGTILDTEATERGLNEAIVFDPATHKVTAAGGLEARRIGGGALDLPPRAATDLARAGDIAILDSPDESTVRAVANIGQTSGLMLVITRPVDPKILEHTRLTDEVVAEYERLNANRARIQYAFVLIFGLLAMLVLVVGMLTGLTLANQIARPLGLLILAARRVSEGDLSVRVPEMRGRSDGRDDEVATLSRAFNRMTDQLDAQRSELMSAYDQLDERRRFMEIVLGGVSAGVIGLDRNEVIELPNRAASRVLHRDLGAAIGRSLRQSVPEFEVLIEAARLAPDHVSTAEIQIDAERAGSALGDGPTVGASGRTLLVRVAAEHRGDRIEGYVVTFDDITALVSAQRKAAWADVARRIAHEIKNPLTPIQLAAERLKRRFMREISSDPDTFGQCVDTIVRHVGDIRRMVDEFSAFARMPQPVLRDEDFSRIVREALILQRNAHPEIVFLTEALPLHGPKVRCDRRLVGQAITNLLQNAADAIAMTPKEGDGGVVSNVLNDHGGGHLPVNVRGHIAVALHVDGQDAVLTVTDDGIGLPSADRHRLTEPYVTHKPKGTGLGLAIVKKIMEDHGGSIRLEDRVEGKGAVGILTVPVADPTETTARDEVGAA